MQKSPLSFSSNLVSLTDPGSSESSYNQKGFKQLMVQKRSGNYTPFSYTELESFVKSQTTIKPSIEIDISKFIEEVHKGIIPNMKTVDILRLCELNATGQVISNFNYNLLASRMVVYEIHKETSEDYLVVLEELKNSKNPKNGKPAPRISDEIYHFARQHIDVIQAALDYSRDYLYDHFAIRTLKDQKYLLHTHQHGKSKLTERPQHMYMRVALQTSGLNIQNTLESYRLLSKQYYIHGTPTLQNAGTQKSQMSSCFLICIKSDSIDGMYSGTKEIAKISAGSGGIGYAVSDIRAVGGYISGSGGTSSGLMPYLNVINSEAVHVDQGGGKRKMAASIGLEVWHPEVETILEAKTEDGTTDKKTRNLFYHFWIPDLFMKRVKTAGKWSYFCPDDVGGLTSTWGEEFEQKYLKAESEGKQRATTDALKLYHHMISTLIQTGGPFMCFKDIVNRKSNHQNIGTIRCTNLCTEIMQYCAPDETAVCNLVSISLKKFVILNSDGTRPENYFDFVQFYEVVKHVTRVMNVVIDTNYYPTKRSRRSNMRHRPIGIGIQGLADTFFLLRFAFTSPEAIELNRHIAEILYYGYVEESMNLAKIDGPYETFVGSPMSKGIFQFDMWDKKPCPILQKKCPWMDWNNLKKQVMTHGLRNSLGVAPMPTATTSQILSNYESFEPINSNIFVRRVLSADETIINKYLMKDLQKLGLYNQTTIDQIISDRGSVQNVQGLPQDLKDLYKTVWEISQKDLIDMAADRGPFVDQSQSLNLHTSNPTPINVGRMILYAYDKGLKTGCYYLRARTPVTALNFGNNTVEQRLGIAHLVPKRPNDSSTVLIKKEITQQQVRINTKQSELIEKFTANPEVCTGGACYS